MHNRSWWRAEWNRTTYDQDRYSQVIARLTELLGNVCVECGSRAELQFDHIDPNDKNFSITKMWNQGDEVLLPELEKCQLLCSDCHKNKTRRSHKPKNEHGGGVVGIWKCKCEPCINRRRERQRERRTSKLK